MILEAILNLFKNLLFIVFGWISLPSFPEGLTNSIDTFLGLIFDKTRNINNINSYFNCFIEL